jgi:4-amino-4-deoxy-L-arabinose transferase-like glycosyltransferase
MNGNVSSSRERVLVALVLLLAVFLRLYQLDTIPPGLTHDEAATGYFVTSVYEGARAYIQAPYGYANEAFTMYSGALFMALMGPTDLALRVHSAFFGVLMILFGYLWTRKAFNVPVALGAAALTAVSFWPISTARFALNPQPAPALFTGAVWFLWLALFSDKPPRSRWWAWLLFALFLGGSLWTYEVARATAAATGAFVVFVALTDRTRTRQQIAWLIGALALGLALGAPHVLNPDAWQRSATLATTLRALLNGDFRPLLTTTLEALGTLTWQGDPFLTYNVPGRPIFDPLMGLMFYGGLIVCACRWRRPAYTLTLLWIAAGLLPSMIVGAWNSTLHSMGMQWVVFVPPAIFAREIGDWLKRRYQVWGPRLVWIGFAILVFLSGALSFRDYFLQWGQWPEVRAAYFQNMAAITSYLDRGSFSTAAISAPFPDLPHDPLIANLRVHRNDLALRWFDAQRAIVFPNTTSSLLIAPSNASIHPYLAERLNLQMMERVYTRADDIDPYFDVFTWEPLATFESLVEEAMPGSLPDMPVNFGAVALEAFVLPENVTPGETITLVTLWRILDPTMLEPVSPQNYGYSVAIFVHLLDADHTIVSQEDRLDAPAWNWQAGDAFAQIHQMATPAGLSPGQYNLRLGLYTMPDMRPLPAFINAQAVGDYILLSPVKIITSE